MTTRAGFQEDGSPPNRIRTQRFQWPEAKAGNLSRRRDPPGNKGKVGDNVPHVPPIPRECGPIEAPLEAIVDSVLEQIDQGITGPVLGESRIHSDQRQGSGLGALPKMTTETSEIGTNVTGQAIRSVPQQPPPPPNREAERTQGNIRLGGNSHPHLGRCGRSRQPLLDPAGAKSGHQYRENYRTLPH